MSDEPRTPWRNAIAAQIRAERAASGMTQREVIAASGIPKSTYLRLESGERRADADQLALIAAAMGVRLSTFFQRAEERLETSRAASTVAQLEANLSPAGRDVVEEGRARLARERAEGEKPEDPPDAPVMGLLRSA